MFVIESPMQCDENSEDWKEGESALKFLESIVFECIGQGHFKNQDPKILAFSIWSYMHGMCSLALRDRMKVYPEEERESMQMKSFEIFKQMLRQL